MNVELLFRGGSSLASPIATDKSLYFISQGTSDIYQLDISSDKANSAPKVWGNTGGHPSGAAFDSNGTLYLTDFAHAGVLAVNSTGDEVVIAKEYEGKQFIGPNSIVFSHDNTIFFSDSGPLGTSTLDNPCGSLYCISGSAERPILRPLSTEKLAHPSGVAVSPDGKCIYVAETMRNRILRYAQRPSGIYHTSVFHQFSGGMGPSSIAISKGGIMYVGRYDFTDCSSQGSIAVLNLDGHVTGEITIPQPEITGIAISTDNSALFVTEASTNSVYKVNLLSSFGK